MVIKKSDLYSSLWQSCDELRDSMDASQYKDYVLVLLFVKYISNKYAGQPYAPITIPDGASFADMVALKGTTDIGDQINKKILGPLADAPTVQGVKGPDPEIIKVAEEYAASKSRTRPRSVGFACWFAPIKYPTVRDPETGVRRQVEVPKRVKELGVHS
jgi:hypothetical protein